MIEFESVKLFGEDAIAQVCIDGKLWCRTDTPEDILKLGIAVAKLDAQRKLRGM